MQTGNIVEFKRKGFASWFLGGILKIFEPSWDGYGWHLAILWAKTYGGWYILESLSDGVGINYISDKYLDENTRIHKWFKRPLSRKKMAKFLDDHIDDKYDVLIYFWTSLQYLIRHYFNHRIPRLLDDRWTCWELIFDFCDKMGKPIGSEYDCPMITDFLKEIKG